MFGYVGRSIVRRGVPEQGASFTPSWSTRKRRWIDAVKCRKRVGVQSEN